MVFTNNKSLQMVLLPLFMCYPLCGLLESRIGAAVCPEPKAPVSANRQAQPGHRIHTKTRNNLPCRVMIGHDAHSAGHRHDLVRRH
jgi:hypothetical protein